MKIKKITCGAVAAIIVLSSFSALAMPTNSFDEGMRKGINYFNKQMYCEARDEFQWFADYNWGTLNSGQQKYLMDYLDGTKAKIQAWEYKNTHLTEKEASEKLYNYLGSNLGTWVSGEENYLSYGTLHNVNGRNYYQFALRGWVYNHSTTLTWYVVSEDGKDIFEGQCSNGYLNRF